MTYTFNKVRKKSALYLGKNGMEVSVCYVIVNLTIISQQQNVAGEND